FSSNEHLPAAATTARPGPAEDDRPGMSAGSGSCGRRDAKGPRAAIRLRHNLGPRNGAVIRSRCILLTHPIAIRLMVAGVLRFVAALVNRHACRMQVRVAR